WTTGDSPIPQLAFQRIYPYSDFLLHDMGSLGDGIGQLAASPTEMRTAPLWGIAQRSRFLHDGRATTIEDAIEAHDGEAAASRERFDRFSPQARQVVIEFVV